MTWDDVTETFTSPAVEVGISPDRKWVVLRFLGCARVELPPDAARKVFQEGLLRCDILDPPKEHPSGPQFVDRASP